jgi:ADP-ribosyl-[dinitrogen reductase] hydrolase
VDVDEARRRIRGSLLAGAVGDALGAPVEFLSLAEIRAQHGPSGVTGYLPAYGRPGGAITDDTQMTLFTAEGMIRALVRSTHRGIVHVPSVVQRAYLRWLATQAVTPAPDPPPGNGWLIGVDDLWARRAPGTTCLTALESGRIGTMAQPVNDSKGCGGVMRVAPVAFGTPIDAFELAAECAALTHGHPSGFLSAGVLGSVIAGLFAGQPLDVALDGATERLRTCDRHDETLAAIVAARDLAAAGRPSPEDLEGLGGGWVGEQALAIAVCCALVARDLVDGLLLAVNHSGDSDSTGTLTGQILGTIHGEEAIPPTLLEDLELRDVITTVADDLADAFHGEGVGGEYQPYDGRVERWLTRYQGA